MLSRSQRLSGDQVAAILTAKTVVFHTPLITIRSFSRGDQNPARFAVIVSKKVSKSAVARNRLRRRTYSAIKDTNFPIGRDYLVSLKQTATFDEYQKDLQSIITKF